MGASNSRLYRTATGHFVSAITHNDAVITSTAVLFLSDPSEQGIITLWNSQCGVQSAYGVAYRPQAGERPHDALSSGPLWEQMDAADVNVEQRMSELVEGIEKRLGCMLCCRTLLWGPAFPLGICATGAACPDDFKGIRDFLTKKTDEWNRLDDGKLVWRIAEEPEENETQCCKCVWNGRKVVVKKAGAALVMLPNGQQVQVQMSMMTAQGPAAAANAAVTEETESYSSASAARAASAAPTPRGGPATNVTTNMSASVTVANAQVPVAVAVGGQQLATSAVAYSAPFYAQASAPTPSNKNRT